MLRMATSTICLISLPSNFHQKNRTNVKMEWGGACIHGGKLFRARQQTRHRQEFLQAPCRDTGQATGQPLMDQGTGQSLRAHRGGPGRLRGDAGRQPCGGTSKTGTNVSQNVSNN